ncbi:hypothetical protein MSG28_007373 [Choristoneura fumiferana]|uniref:Uncharacterized protein n=1 Tax=Choristoneura fumiferana TaxID=7141 RepID=A0ACC0JX84_CHOFU|nr:hypothetical protein MSG28_007373 [Choristoneura fumiferana]
MNDDKQFWLVKKTIAKLVSFESVAILRRSASLQLLATTNLTTSRPHSMKKKTRAGAQRSKGSPTITCEYAASTIRATSPIEGNDKKDLRPGTSARVSPKRISSAPTVRRYHFDGSLKSNVSEGAVPPLALSNPPSRLATDQQELGGRPTTEIAILIAPQQNQCIADLLMLLNLIIIEKHRNNTYLTYQNLDVIFILRVVSRVNINRVSTQRDGIGGGPVKFIFPIMSDDGSTAVEKKGRGRPKANGTQAEAKADTKKRGRPPAATKAKESTKSSDDEQAPVAKRGRGRPKGSKKRAAAPKAKGGSGEGRGRGRPRKDAPPPRKDAASTEEEQDDEDEDEGSDQ